MRIKSFFAPSVQAAIGMARREFGDEITLITSHVASPDSRHLGEYEVVFAINEPVVEEASIAEPAVVAEEILALTLAEPDPEPLEMADDDKDESEDRPEEVDVAAAAPRFTAFQEVLLDAVTEKPPQKSAGEQLDGIRATLIELAVEPGMVRALMTLIERSIDAAALPPRYEQSGVVSDLTASLASAGPRQDKAASIASVVDEVFASLDSTSASPTPVPEPARSTFATNVNGSVGVLQNAALTFVSGTTLTAAEFAFAASQASESSTITIAAPATPAAETPAPSKLTNAELAFVMSISEASDSVLR